MSHGVLLILGLTNWASLSSQAVWEILLPLPPQNCGNRQMQLCLVSMWVLGISFLQVLRVSNPDSRKREETRGQREHRWEIVALRQNIESKIDVSYQRLWSWLRAASFVGNMNLFEKCIEMTVTWVCGWN